jgi:hypothetical protein
MPHFTTTAIQEAISKLTLPDVSRVWMYTASRVLSDEETTALQSHLRDFGAQWAAHGKALCSESIVILNQIVLLAVDESAQVATGCSIDASVNTLKGLENVMPSMHDVDVFDRSWVLFCNAESGSWERARLHDFWAMRKAGSLSDDTPIFDTTQTQLGEVRTAGIKALGDSWHAHMW